MYNRMKLRVGLGTLQEELGMAIYGMCNLNKRRAQLHSNPPKPFSK